MRTSDLIALLKTVPALADLQICNSRVPTKNAVTGVTDIPFIWVQHRNDLIDNCQTPGQPTQPLGKWWDVEVVAATPDEAEDLRDAVYSLHTYQGAMGNAYADLLTIDDQSDDYAVRNASDDAGVFIDSLLVQVMGE